MGFISCKMEDFPYTKEGLDGDQATSFTQTEEESKASTLQSEQSQSIGNEKPRRSNDSEPSYGHKL